jgi:tRNA 2-thiouridine synthesizing protein A
MAAPPRPGSATDPVVAQPIVPDKSIDCIGFFCPIPILKTREAMKSLAVGQILAMLSDDPSSDPDMKSWAQRTGNELFEISRKERCIVSSSGKSASIDPVRNRIHRSACLAAGARRADI